MTEKTAEAMPDARPGLAVCCGGRAGLRGGRARCLGRGEQVPGAGQQLRGDRDSGDLIYPGLAGFDMK